MKLRDVAKSIGLEVGCQSKECRWGECDGQETVDYCDCDDRRGSRYETEDMTRVAQHLAAEVEKFSDAWENINRAAGTEDLQPEQHGAAIARYIDDTVGRAAQVFRDARKLHEAVDRMRPVVDAAREVAKDAQASPHVQRTSMYSLISRLDAYEKEGNRG